MSGGVDSSVAAALLVRAGLRRRRRDDEALLPRRRACPTVPAARSTAINDARRVCEPLGVPHYVLNLESAFGRDVVDDFVDEYARGRTPIPCVRCNTFTKFRDLLHKADAIDATWIATGHYARVRRRRAAPRARSDKDQSYFLWGIDRAVLSRMLLPVGAQTKAETRARRARARAASSSPRSPRARTSASSPTAITRRSLARELGQRRAGARARARSCRPTARWSASTTGFARFTIGQRRGASRRLPRSRCSSSAIRAADRARW